MSNSFKAQNSQKLYLGYKFTLELLSNRKFLMSMYFTTRSGFLKLHSLKGNFVEPIWIGG